MALSSMKSRLGAALMSAVVAATPLAAGLAPTDAEAQTARATPTATQQAQVPVRDVRGLSDGFLRITAAEVSKKAVVIIVRGENQQLYEKVRKAAQEATAEGFPVRGILVAKGKDGVEIYANAQSYAVHNDPGPAIEAQTKGAIKDAHRLMQKVGMADGPALAEVK